MKFDVLADPRFFTTPLQVSYSQSYPVCNHIREPLKIGTLLMCKSKEWEYEQEYRVMKQDAVGLHSFKKNALVEIIFGCKVQAQNMQNVRTIAETSDYPRLSFSKACAKEKDFGLDFLPL
jgi:hypothetical protein